MSIKAIQEGISLILNAIMIVIMGIDREGFATEVEDALNGLTNVQTVVLEEQSLV